MVKKKKKNQKKKNISKKKKKKKKSNSDWKGGIRSRATIYKLQALFKLYPATMTSLTPLL